MDYRASRVSTVTLDTNQTFNSGRVFTVFGILIANSTNQAAEVEFTDGSGNIEFMMVCPACDSKVLDIEFIADGGLQVSGLSNANVRATIFHNYGA